MYSLSSHWNVAAIWIWTVSVTGFDQYNLTEMILCNFWKCIRCFHLCWFGTLLLGTQLLCCENPKFYAETIWKRPQAHQLISSAELPAKSQHQLTVMWMIILYMPAQSGFPRTATLATQSQRTTQMSSVNPDKPETINSYCLKSLSFGITLLHRNR